MRKATAAPDRRRGYRQQTPASATLLLADDDAGTMTVHVFDRSMFGVGFSADRPLQIGTICRLTISDPRPLVTQIEIRSCRARPDGMFDIGAQFC